MELDLEAAVNRWHRTVNDAAGSDAKDTVTDPIIVLGPQGAGPITPADFTEWIQRSGIRLIPRSWHPTSDRLMVVGQDATWPGAAAPSSVATVFRVSGEKVSAALRLPDLTSALELAYICREMAATE